MRMITKIYSRKILSYYSTSIFYKTHTHTHIVNPYSLFQSLNEDMSITEVIKI